ncbi:MAG: hypothetical protein ACW98Y_07280 [Candidatus Thorarchaeota archaeon]
MASLPPIIELPLGDDEALRVFSPAAYPFSIQQYRDYENRLFSYAIAIGWPEGTLIIQRRIMDDQSEFIHMEHYSSGLSLGLILLAGMITSVAILSLIDRRRLIPKDEMSNR